MKGKILKGAKYKTNFDKKKTEIKIRNYILLMEILTPHNRSTIWFGRNFKKCKEN